MNGRTIGRANARSITFEEQNAVSGGGGANTSVGTSPHNTGVPPWDEEYLDTGEDPDGGAGGNGGAGDAGGGKKE